MTVPTTTPAVRPSLPERPEDGLWPAVVTELRRAFRRPPDVPVILAANAALMCGGWFLLPDALRDWLFSVHGTLAFPIVLESWMLSDVPATNVLGADAPRALAALADRRALQRFLYAKTIALWLLVAPICALVALIIGTSQHHRVATAAICAVILVMPFGVLGISAWLGILFPYHPRPIRWRWQHRRDQPRSLVRWMILVIAPYSFVPAVCGLVVFPSIYLTSHGTHAASRLLTQRGFTLGAGLACAAAVLAFVVGHAIGARFAEAREADLMAYLADPELG